MSCKDSLRLGPLPALDKRVKEVNTIAPLYTVLLCPPAALALNVYACGVAAPVVHDGTAHHALDRGQAIQREERLMRQHGSLQSGKRGVRRSSVLYLCQVFLSPTICALP